MQGLPVIEDFIAVVNDIEKRAEEPAKAQQEEGFAIGYAQEACAPVQNPVKIVRWRQPAVQRTPSGVVMPNLSPGASGLPGGFCTSGEGQRCLSSDMTCAAATQAGRAGRRAAEGPWPPTAPRLPPRPPQGSPRAGAWRARAGCAAGPP